MQFQGNLYQKRKFQKIKIHSGGVELVRQWCGLDFDNNLIKMVDVIC